MTCLRIIIFACAFACVPLAAAQAEPRALDAQFTDIDLLFNILRATVDGINIDDPAVLEAEFPGAQFTDFDRDRNGEFMTFGAGLGLFDLTLAIMQFNHDPVDADGDGVMGFYELECEYAGAGISLDPTAAQTTEGISDGSVDCDGDGSANLVEINAGTNPLDPTDFPEADFEIVDPGIEEQPLTAVSEDGVYTLTLEPARTHVFEGDGMRLEGEFVQ